MKHTFLFATRTSHVAIVCILLTVLLALLLQPTLQPVRTVEFVPEGREVPVAPAAVARQDVSVPAGAFTHVAVWVAENSDGVPVAGSYDTVQLEILSADGALVRADTSPKLTERGGEAALLFNFDRIAVEAEQRYVFVVKQTGDTAARLREPQQDMIRPGETAAAAFQALEQTSWLGALLDIVYAEDLDGRDISFYYHRGQQIVAGINPYACVLQGGCKGYPSHFPGMYWLSAGFIALGADDLGEWVMVWRPVVFAAWLLVGGILFVHLFRRGRPALAVAALAFWLFNRWSLYVLRVAHTDFVGVLFLLLAVLLIGRWPMLAALLLGISLAIKQIGIVAVPLFVLVIWRQRKHSALQMLLLAGMVLAVPLVSAAPFLFDDAGAVLRGWFNPVTRAVQTDYEGVASLDVLIGVTHAGRLSLALFLIAAVYAAAWRRSVGILDGTAMILATLIAFAPVLFHQYFVWLVPFLLLAVVQSAGAMRSQHL
jgi:hypothetical protein